MNANSSRSLGSRISEWLKDGVVYLAGALMYALSVNVFTSPNDIAPGGVTGIATILHSLFGWPIGLVMLLINIPLFVAGLVVIGKRYTIRTLVCLGIVTAVIDLTAPFAKAYAYTGDMMIACLFGGVLTGLALGVIFTRGGSTGGTDIIARLLGKAFPNLTQGRLILVADLAVVVTAGVVFGFEKALYATITLFTSSFVVDKVMYGADNGKMVFIVTNKIDEVNQAIDDRLGRGTTVLSGRGGYSGDTREMILCAIRDNQAYMVQRLVRSIDPNAFVVACDASEILGNGFRSLSVNEFGENIGEEPDKPESEPAEIQEKSGEKE